MKKVTIRKLLFLLTLLVLAMLLTSGCDPNTSKDTSLVGTWRAIEAITGEETETYPAPSEEDPSVLEQPYIQFETDVVKMYIKQIFENEDSVVYLVSESTYLVSGDKIPYTDQKEEIATYRISDNNIIINFQEDGQTQIIKAVKVSDSEVAGAISL